MLPGAEDGTDDDPDGVEDAAAVGDAAEGEVLRIVGGMSVGGDVGRAAVKPPPADGAGAGFELSAPDGALLTGPKADSRNPESRSYKGGSSESLGAGGAIDSLSTEGEAVAVGL